MRKRLFFHNALILTCTALVLRAAGMFFRVWVANRLGDEGMGLYQLIFTLYNLSITLATTGVSVAASRMVTGWMASGRGSPVYLAKKVARYSFCAGLFVGVLQFIFADAACSFVLSDPRAAPALRILAPSLPFMALGAALRGCFAACRRVQSSAVSQLFEQAVRIGIVMCLLPCLLPYGEAAACGAVVAGNTLSEMLSAGYMALAWQRYLKKEKAGENADRPRGSLREFGALCLPVTATRGISSLLVTAENVLVPTALAVKLGGRAQALAVFGQLKGMAMPVVFMPFSVLATFSSLLLPEVTEAHVRRDAPALKRLLNITLRFTGVSAVYIGGMVVLFAQELGSFLYHSPQVGFYLRVLGPLAPFLYLESMVDGLLRGMDEQMATFRYSLVDSVLRIGAVVLVVPRYGIEGFLFVMIFSNLFTCGANFNRLVRVTGIKPVWADLAFKPLFSVLMAGCAWRYLALPVLPALPLWVQLVLGGGVVTGVYLLFLWLLGCIGKGELAALKLQRKFA